MLTIISHTVVFIYIFEYLDVNINKIVIEFIIIFPMLSCRLSNAVLQKLAF